LKGKRAFYHTETNIVITGCVAALSVNGDRASP